MAKNDSEEWGPWIEHDGKGCPCVGMLVEVILRNGYTEVCIAGEQCRSAGVDVQGHDSAWVHRIPRNSTEVIRYRIRKPKGLTILEKLISDLSAHVLKDVVR